MGKVEVRVQDVSMTIILPDRKTDDRRHKVWCKYYEKGICFSPNNWAYYNNHCPGSKHCKYYKEEKRPPIPPPPPPPPVSKHITGKPISKYTAKDFEIGDIIVCVDGWYGEIIDIKLRKNYLLATVRCDNDSIKKISLDSYSRDNRLEFV
ncbi:MAG: hypothetical protein E7353_05680 [Clostridiales bacterium]|nr:hypothetical protein [Clostridiales bacterium]